MVRPVIVTLSTEASTRTPVSVVGLPVSLSSMIANFVASFAVHVFGVLHCAGVVAVVLCPMIVRGLSTSIGSYRPGQTLIVLPLLAAAIATLIASRPL